MTEILVSQFTVNILLALVVILLQVQVSRLRRKTEHLGHGIDLIMEMELKKSLNSLFSHLGELHKKTGPKVEIKNDVKTKK